MVQVDLDSVRRPPYKRASTLLMEEIGNSSALASVSGPLEVRLREEQPDKATFEILHRPLEGVGGGSFPQIARRQMEN
jgi:hypothetical protein